MAEPWTVLQLFPENGLDRSLHAPVFIGLIFLVFFRETLGWGFAGLVVPGYLATVLIAAPVTGGLVVLEAIITYIGALLLGRTLPRTGAWFTFFGRERFLLLVTMGSLVRLAIEGSLLPALMQRFQLTHSRELYSLGLVLVPLLANTFWNAGFVRAFPRVGLVTTLTYLIVAELLLPYTNFTLSRFQVANESVSLAFLESPHAHIILLVGAILGARNNVRYGWDYNGILVPALLAVAWYQPTKVATTLLEGLVVYYSSMWLIRRRPFSRMMFVGCRRVVTTFSVGFIIKYVSGALLVRWLPHVQLIDFFGFGYLLPSLIATKMWDKGGVPRVLMPTLQVSAMAFPLGTIIGFGLRSLESAPEATSHAARLGTAASVPWALMLGDSAPSPHRSGTTLKLSDAYAVGREVARRSIGGELDDTTLALAERGQLEVQQPSERDWTIITPHASDPNVDVAGPRLALRSTYRYGDDWLVVVEAPAVGSPSIPIAFALADRIGARVILLSSRLPTLAARDEELGRELSSDLALTHTLRVALDGEGGIELGVVGSLPAGLGTNLFEDVLGRSVRLDWRAATAGPEDASRIVRLELPASDAETIAATLLGSPDVESWVFQSHAELARRLTELTFSTPQGFRVPTIPELRLYGALLSERFRAPAAPSPWQRSTAAALGLRFAHLDAPFEGFALYEPTGPLRRGQPTLLQRERARGASPPLALTLPAPRWETGTVAASARLYTAFEADALVVHGALVNVAPDGSSDPRRPRGRQSMYQRAQEAWLNAGGTTVIVRAIAPSHPVTTDAVVTFDSEVDTTSGGPEWTRAWLGRLERAGITLGALDGSAERAGFEASADPAVAYARRFAPGRSLILWLAPALREAWRQAYTSRPTQHRLAAAGIPIHSLPPEAFFSELGRCPDPILNGSRGGPCPFPPGCERAARLPSLQRFLSTHNPYYLEAALTGAARCGWQAMASPITQTIWLALPPDATDPARAWRMLPLSNAGSERDEPAATRTAISKREFCDLDELALRPLDVMLE